MFLTPIASLLLPLSSSSNAPKSSQTSYHITELLATSPFHAFIITPIPSHIPQCVCTLTTLAHLNPNRSTGHSSLHICSHTAGTPFVNPSFNILMIAFTRSHHISYISNALCTWTDIVSAYSHPVSLLTYLCLIYPTLSQCSPPRSCSVVLSQFPLVSSSQHSTVDSVVVCEQDLDT